MLYHIPLFTFERIFGNLIASQINDVQKNILKLNCFVSFVDIKADADGLLSFWGNTRIFQKICEKY